MDPNTVKSFDILLVEDNPDDVVITQKAFEIAKVSASLSIVENGKECMSFLKRESPYGSAPRPDLILLDLNMPIMDGRQTLAEIVKDDSFRSIPVVVLTTSNAETDLVDMYQMRCSSYIKKPVDLNEFLEVIESLNHYWVDVVERPPKGG